MKANFLRKLFTVSLLSMAAGGFIFAADAKVVSVKGKVEVQKNGAWVALTEGESLEKGALVSTGFNSQAVIRMNNNALVTLAPLTRITIEQLAETDKKEETRLFMDSGNVKFKVSHTGSRRSDFKVRSPVATASVRGTEGVIYATGLLSVSDGLVSLGQPESSSAQIAGDASDFVPQEGESTAFTPTSEVSDSSNGIPVYKGQTAVTDSYTGEQTAPQTVAKTQSHNLTGITSPQAVVEAGTTDASIPTTSARAKLANLEITISLPD